MPLRTSLVTLSGMGDTDERLRRPRMDTAVLGASPPACAAAAAGV